MPSLLTHVIQKCIATLPASGKASLRHVLSQWDLGSLCSGADTAVHALDCISRELGAELIQHTMACDIDSVPRLFAQLHGRQRRLSMDVARLCCSDGCATDAMSGGKLQPAPSCKTTLHGTVDKQFSSLCFAENRNKSIHDDATGAADDSSLATLNGVLSYIKEHTHLCL